MATNAEPSTAVTATSNRVEKKDEASTDAHLQLLTEHFGFNPKAFIDALVFLANEHLYKIAEQFELVVMQQLRDVAGGELEAEQGVHAILTLMENALDHTLDTFELYCLRSVFGIRTRQARYMTLAHHRGLDLRPSNSSKANSKTSASTSIASERSYQLGETEDSLKRKIAAAKATQHKLLLGRDAAQKGLDRALEVADRFAVMLVGRNTVKGEDVKHAPQPMLTETLGQHARKLKADTTPLLKALRELRNTDPLGDPLSAPPPKRENADHVGEESGEEEQAPPTRAWQRGREPYLNWEADRIIAKSKRAEAPPFRDTAAQDAATGEQTKTPKRKHTGTAPTSSKRTPGTAHKPSS